jgi:membrane-bound ClpP family serine protease
MKYIELALFIVGVVALVVGYRKSHRNVLLSAAIILFLAGNVGDFAHGFQEGFSAGWSSTTVTKSPA